jgi:uncharacterized protein YuzE
MKSTVVLFFLLTLSSRALAQEPISKLDTSKIYYIVEQDAEFPGGLDAQLKYINDNFNSRVQGCGDFAKIDERIVVSFVVEKDGSITNIEIEKASTSCPPCNAEVLRIVKAMPNWQPAQIAGLNVRSSVRHPIILNF